MKKKFTIKLLVLMFAIYHGTLSIAQEGTKQLMPNSTDRLYLNVGDLNFARYGCPERARLNIYLNAGETMHFGMQVQTGTRFRIRNSSNTIVYPETNTPTAGNPGHIANYIQAITGPTGTIRNGTTISGGYNALTYTATSSGSHYIEFRANTVITFFDVTVTDATGNIKTNPSNPNVSAGRLWSRQWSFTTTSFTLYPVNADFYVYTGDEFVNKVNFQMKPFVFNFVANSFGAQNTGNIILDRQSFNGNSFTSDMSEYSIFLNDPDQVAYPSTSLPPPVVQAWFNGTKIYDFDYNRSPQILNINPGEIVVNINDDLCTDPNVTFFKITTNISGTSTILIDVNGDGFFVGTNDVAIIANVSVGDNFIPWDLKDAAGNEVTEGNFSCIPQLLARGPAHFPIYDDESLNAIETYSVRPFEKFDPTLYWDDYAIPSAEWGDDFGAMSTSSVSQYRINSQTPRIWTYFGENGGHDNGNLNTFNSWFYAIDLGLSNLDFKVAKAGCTNGALPVVSDIYKSGPVNSTIIFSSTDFENKYADGGSNPIDRIRIVNLPSNGILYLSGVPINAGNEITYANLGNITFVPTTDWMGSAQFSWNANNGTNYATSDAIVHISINTPPSISAISNAYLCVNTNSGPLSFIVGDIAGETSPDDITLSATSGSLNTVPVSGIVFGGSGTNRTITISPATNKSGSSLITVFANDGFSSSSTQFWVVVGPSLEIDGALEVCPGNNLVLNAVEPGADSYLWEFGGSTISTSQNLTISPYSQANAGVYTLTVSKGSCSGSADYVVSDHHLVSFSGNTAVCNGGIIELTADEFPATYVWSKGGTPIGTSRTLTINPAALSDEGSDYRLTVSRDGCSISSGLFDITVDDCPPPLVSLSIDNISIAENGGIATITATLNNAWVQDVYVTISFSGTATGGGVDYDASGLVIFIPAGSISGSLQLTAYHDDTYEGDEPIIADITNVNDGGFGAAEDGIQQVTTEIIDDDPAPEADLSVLKIVSNNTPNVGDNVVFTITVLNNGPDDATGVEVTDNLLSGYAYLSDNGGGAYSGGTWTIGDLANGASASLQITATVNASGSYANTATVSSPLGDPIPGNNSSTNTPIPVPQADLVITKSINNTTPDVGQNVVFTLTVSNNGPSDATGVSVTDNLPAGYSFVSASASAGSWTAPVWSIGNLANGASVTLDITATVLATGPYNNTATVSGDQPDPVPGDEDDEVIPVPAAQADLVITKSINNTTPDVGQSVVFTITVTNNGPSDATGVSVTDNLPAGYSFVSASASAGSWTAPVWSIGNLANGASVTLDITATVLATGPYNNTATVSGDQPDPVPGDEDDEVIPVPAAQADLVITKSINNTTPDVGQSVVFTITVTNNGPSDATGVSVTDNLPAGYSFVSASASAGSWTAPVWSIGNLANGASVTLDITATVLATGPYNNTATVSGDQPDPVPGDEDDEVIPVPAAQADLVITKSINNTTPDVGQNVVFTITVTNNGPSDATGVSVTDNLPAGYSFVSASASAGSWTAPVWSIGNLANGASVTLDITATVLATGPYNNTATVSGDQPDPVPGDEDDEVIPVPAAQADLVITKSINNTTPDVGQNVVFTITVTNNGPSDATGVSVTDNLPAGYSFVSASASAGSWTAPVWSIGNLANGASVTLDITATVLATGPYNNTATVSGDQPDPVPGDEDDEVIPVPAAQADLVITKSINNTTPDVGQNVVFTITVTNNGPSDATGVSVTDNLPAGYSFVSASASAGSWTAPVWSIGNLANGASVTLDITATVLATGPYNNTATVSGDQPDPVPGDEDDEVIPVPAAQADLVITKSINNTTPDVGQSVVFTITVTNNGPSDATGVSVTDNLPAGYSFVSASASAGSWTAPVWSIGNLANGASVTLDITATVLATGPYNNTATVSGDQPDPVPGDEDDEVVVIPVISELNTDLGIVKAVNITNTTVGSEVIYTLTVSNYGPDNASGVLVTDTLNTGFTYITDNGSGNYNSFTGIWDIGDMISGSSLSLEITVMVNPTGNYANIALVSGMEKDPDTFNNTSRVELEVENGIQISGGISPNNDGKNDTWVIRGLEAYPNHKVMIFNRWGNKVYEASPYLNDWDGTSMFGLTVGGNQLPVGTYFYIIEPGNSEKAIKGYIYLNK